MTHGSSIGGALFWSWLGGRDLPTCWASKKVTNWRFLKPRKTSMTGWNAKCPKATLPLKPATIAFKMGHLAFQVAGKCLKPWMIFVSPIKDGGWFSSDRHVSFRGCPGGGFQKKNVHPHLGEMIQCDLRIFCKWLGWNHQDRSRWFQLNYFWSSSLKLGKMNPIWRTHFFRWGWFNHQPTPEVYFECREKSCHSPPSQGHADHGGMERRSVWGAVGGGVWWVGGGGVETTNSGVRWGGKYHRIRFV